MDLTFNQHNDYFALMQERPEDFRQSAILEIVTDEDIICAYEREHQKKIGIMYRSPYHILVVDLVRGEDGRLFPYERILHTVSTGAVVCVPMVGDRFVLMRQFRHAMREVQYAFPRGFGEKGLSPEENIRKELGEELGAQVESVSPLGIVIADSGLCGIRVHAFVAKLAPPLYTARDEGILEAMLLTAEELRQKIRQGQINDGFTLSVLTLLDAVK